MKATKSCLRGRGCVGSVSEINSLKSALSTEVIKRLAEVSRVSAGAATGDIAGTTAKLSGVKNAAFEAITGLANVIKQLNQLLLIVR